MLSGVIGNSRDSKPVSDSSIPAVQYCLNAWYPPLILGCDNLVLAVGIEASVLT